MFRFGKQRFKKSLRTTREDLAEAARTRLDENIRLVMSGRLTIPDGADVATFLLSDGKLNRKPSAPPPLTLGGLTKAFLESLPDGTMEANSLYTAKIHLAHFERILGKGFAARGLGLDDLQGYVRERAKQKGRRNGRVSPTTIRKEITTLSGVWGWARATGRVEGPFPNKGLRYAKTSEKPPFQTREEIERQISRGGLSAAEQELLWDCLYLTGSDLEEVLEIIKQRAANPVLYPMCVLAGHTGARRSEILRAQVGDFDLEANLVLLHEKKRAKGKRTSRLVPLSPLLAAVISEWLKTHACCKYAFCQAVPADVAEKTDAACRPLPARQASDYLGRALAGTDWEKIRGWHVFRHSFISNCASKGIDQRIIDAWSGHQTEEMRRRYTHLFPDSQQQAMKALFNGSVKG
jgi:integrase